MDPVTREEVLSKKHTERLSSAFTLSDMEIFIFPELFYPLVIANIMSPELWKWRDDPWFEGIEGRGFTWKANRIKQYIIQNYVFNLDLATWGLTTKDREISRFSDFFDIAMLRQSNALFGYEGDKYYFDIDIRKHFGLDKYDSDIIPYWKTETIEAMGAFRHKEGFTTGAGECVSLSSLYAAAMFVVGRIPLEKIFLIATPLHSQNFITEKEGLLTNNRRIVTKNMWFNGTSLSEKARRALENEKVTIVSHISGYIHTLYEDATIDPAAYGDFTARLKAFLDTELTDAVFINFLRFKSRYKTLFQYRCECSGTKRYITLDKMFEYEHSSKHTVAPESRQSLVCEIEGEEFHLSPVQGLLMLNDFENIIDSCKGKGINEIRQRFIDTGGPEHAEALNEMIDEIKVFIHTDPRLPEHDKRFRKSSLPGISVSDSRAEIVSKITESRSWSEVSELSLYVYRQMDLIDWLPFIKAAIERNPVSFESLDVFDTEEKYRIIAGFENKSIYGKGRLALPDEVWNFRRGDGLEMALLLASNIIHTDTSAHIEIITGEENTLLGYKGKSYEFVSSKGFRKKIEIKGYSYRIIPA